VLERTLAERRARTHGLVEGALLTDIAIVFLLMRVYLPLPIVRTLLRALATVPLVVLTQRRGVKITVLASIAGYILFSALVGPLLGLAAIDIAIAGILVGVGRRAGFGIGVNTLCTGPVYALLDLILPTIATVILFRYPVKVLIKAARNFLHLMFNVLATILRFLHMPASMLHDVKTWEQVAVAHWQIAWLAVIVLAGLSIMYIVVVTAEIVLRQLPQQTLARQEGAS
jgi:hypothetical protein